ncbi:MAG: hypothetical protein ABIL25_02275 [candidate division WOR-3 bacterium]
MRKMTHDQRPPASWLLLLSVLAAVAPVWAKTAGKPWKPSRVFDFRWYQKNQWRLPVTNYATFGYGIGRPGGEWPAGSGDMYIYGAGIWIGCLRKSSSGKDTLVSCGYNPNSGKSEMTPGAYDNATGGYSERGFERVYIYPGDWPPNELDFPASMSGGRETPLRIRGDTAFRDTFFYVPRKPTSLGDAWAVFNDRDPEQHVAGPRGKADRPIGVEVYQETYSWTLPWNKDIVFFKLTVRNRTQDTLRDMYLGMACDADVGNATDDWCGLALAKYIYSPSGNDSVWVDNMGYVWSDDASPSGFVGFDFLQSPFWKDADGKMREVAPAPGHDSIYPNGFDDNGNGLVDEPAEGRQLGMTSFKIFTLTDADPKDDAEQFLAMAGYDYWDPLHPYNPYDSSDQAPADKRFLQSTGPFALAPDEMATVTIGLIAAKRSLGGPPGTMVYDLAIASRAAQAAYDNNWIMPEPPPSPDVTTIPGDGRVTIVWDDLPEKAKDRFFPVAPALLNPFYVEQDFQGYKIYRSRSGQPGDWQLLTQYDKIDGILFADTAVVESLRTRATDAGLAYCYVDSSNLRLGFPYYYAVTSYDINYLGDTTGGRALDTMSLESGITAVRAVPRTQPSNYTAPQSEWRQVAGNPALRMSVRPFAVSPHAVKDETYRIQFRTPVYDPVARAPVYGFAVTDKAGDTVVPLVTFVATIDRKTDTFQLVPTVFDSVITRIARIAKPGGDSVIDTSRAWLPVVEMTLRLQLDSIPLQPFQRVVVVSGSYPQDSLSLPIATQNKALWAFRGSNYRIVWKSHPSGKLTCDVFDIENQIAVPYRYYSPRAASPDSADGWCFRDIRDAADTFSLGKTWFMYLCGSTFGFNPSGPAKFEPAPGDTWIVYSQTLSPTPYNAAYDVEFKAAQFAKSDTAKLNVKVVPNPYLVRNEWERHPDFRKLKFINLPSKCTIRIYNLAGDLVRTLTHDETKPEAGGLPNQYGGDEDWDLLNENSQKPAPGLYIFHVDANELGTQVGKFVLVY